VRLPHKSGDRGRETTDDQQVGMHQLREQLSTARHAETVQLGLKSLGLRGVPADFHMP
jgi:hypothetical protein